jgi:hypothetical protein
METMSPIIVKKKPVSVVKKKTKSVVKRKVGKEKKQKVALREPSSIPEGELIKRKSDPYWKEKGWKISYLKSLLHLRKVYVGIYKTNYASFRGEIVGDKLYIFRPSREILRGPHGACFTPAKSLFVSQKYLVHFSPYPEDINSGIASVERTIIESFTI